MDFENEIYDTDRHFDKTAPVDIGKWLSYEPYHSEDQLSLQRENIERIPISNKYGQIGFIYSKNIDNLEYYLEEISKNVSIENAEVILETEVFYTSKIEGAKTSIVRTQAIHNGVPIDETNKFSEAMLKGNFEAVKLLNLYGNHLDEKILCKVWKTLTNECCDNMEIQGDVYRNGEVTVSNSAFESVASKDLPNAMSDFFNFYNGPEFDEVPFVKAALIHYAFETIHPFCDGNGRLGRLLMNNYLIRIGIESCRAVSFSKQIDASRGLYDAAFTDSENALSDATPFVEYILEVMSKAYYEAAS